MNNQIDTKEKAIQAAKDNGITFDYIAAFKNHKKFYLFITHYGLSGIAEMGYWFKASKLVVFHTLPRPISLDEYRNLERISEDGNPSGNFNIDTKIDPKFL